MTTADGTGARHSWGADEHLFVELDEEMSLQAYFRSMAVVSALRERRPEGVIDICPANASLQVRFDPDAIAPDRLDALLREIEAEVGDAHDFELETRIVEIPVLYNDPWTHETLMRFRDNHQDPDGTDLDYAARINGFDDVQGFIDAHASAPWMASMVGFVAGLPFLYQMVPRERQLEVPKYVRPRTDTPALTVGHGGCFGCIYSVRGAGGYQMFGITPAPIYDPAQRSPDFADFVCFFEPGDIVKFEPIDRERYDALRTEAEAGTFRIRHRPATFDLQAFTADPDAYNQRLLEVLRAD
jgi:urea carboxylase